MYNFTWRETFEMTPWSILCSVKRSISNHTIYPCVGKKFGQVMHRSVSGFLWYHVLDICNYPNPEIVGTLVYVNSEKNNNSNSVVNKTFRNWPKSSQYTITVTIWTLHKCDFFHIWVQVMSPHPYSPPKVFSKRKSIPTEIFPDHKGSHSRHTTSMQGVPPPPPFIHQCNVHWRDDNSGRVGGLKRFGWLFYASR